MISRFTGNAPAVSPNGKWVVCQCAVPQYPAGTLVVVPLDAPNDARAVALPGVNPEQVAFAWTGAGAVPYLDRLEIEVRSDVMADVPHRLTAVATDQTGALLPHPELRWSATGSGLVRIDSVTGLLIARDTGVVMVEASAGGWRTARRRIHIIPREASVVLHEDWAQPLTRRWWLFGAPEPTTERTRDHGTVFLNNGDGSYPSGAFSLRTFSAGRGLALDAVASVHVTRGQHQIASFGLTARDSIERIPDDKRELGDIGNSVDVCVAAFPGGAEGTFRTETISLEGTREPSPLIPSPDGLYDGRWFRLRLQLFPDGRCGLAVNGVQILVTSLPDSVGRPVRISLKGASRYTRIAVGAVTLTQGVPDDVDWSKVPLRVHDHSRARP